MTLILSNDDVSQVLTMKMTVDALEDSYKKLITKEVVCRPRVDIQIPTSEPGKTFKWGTMEGGSTSGYFAVRMKSDVTYEDRKGGVVTHEKYCLRPGLYCGLILLIDVRNAEPVALINDGILQHMRVGADSGIGAKYIAREDAEVIGMIGSGGMARTHMEAFTTVRKIKKLQVFSPTKAHREAFAAEMADKYGIEVKVCDKPEDIYKGADIVAGCTDSAVPVIDGSRIEKGTHITNIGGGGRPDRSALDRVDVYLRFGNAPAPWGLPQFAVADEYLTYAAQPANSAAQSGGVAQKRARGIIDEEKVIYLADILQGSNRGRSARDQISYSERGNLQGAQFWAVASQVYEAAKARGLGRELPTDWLLQDIRD